MTGDIFEKSQTYFIWVNYQGRDSTLVTVSHCRATTTLLPPLHNVQVYIIYNTCQLKCCASAFETESCAIETWHCWLRRDTHALGRKVSCKHPGVKLNTARVTLTTHYSRFRKYHQNIGVGGYLKCFLPSGFIGSIW